MTPTEAASTLRALGWRCEPPEALAAPIPLPEVGQLWRASSGRIAPRTVTGFASRWGKDCVVYSHTGTGGETTHLPLVSWQAWARKAGARPVTAPHTAPAFQPAPTLAPDGEAAIAPPQAPRVGEVWRVCAGERTGEQRDVVGGLVCDGVSVVVYVVPYGHGVEAATLTAWRRWVQRSGATLVPPVSDPQPAAEPPAPEVGQVWEAPDYIARTVANIDAWHVWYRLHGYPDRVHAAKQSRWCAWVRRSGAKVVG